MVVQATPVGESDVPGRLVQAMPIGGANTVLGRPVSGPGGEPMQGSYQPRPSQSGDQIAVMYMGECIDEPAPDPTCLAAVTCFCCFCPTGICALLKAQEVSRANAEGNFPLAHKKRKEAMMWIYITFAIGFLLQIVSTLARGRAGDGGGQQLLLL